MTPSHRPAGGLCRSPSVGPLKASGSRTLSWLRVQEKTEDACGSHVSSILKFRWIDCSVKMSWTSRVLKLLSSCRVYKIICTIVRMPKIIFKKMDGVPRRLEDRTRDSKSGKAAADRSKSKQDLQQTRKLGFGCAAASDSARSFFSNSTATSKERAGASACCRLGCVSPCCLPRLLYMPCMQVVCIRKTKVKLSLSGSRRSVLPCLAVPGSSSCQCRRSVLAEPEVPCCLGPGTSQTSVLRSSRYHGAFRA